MNTPVRGNTALFFGSFNPVHTGHMIMAQYFAEVVGFQQLWFVVSPENPFKTGDASLLAEESRLKLVELAIAGNPKFAACDIEFRLPKPSYTYLTLQALKQKHPEHRFSLIMGSDNLGLLEKWRNHKEILSEYDIHVYPRPGHPTARARQHKRIFTHKAPLLEISSSFIRKMIFEGKSPRYWLPDNVLNKIAEAGYYR